MAARSVGPVQPLVTADALLADPVLGERHELSKGVLVPMAPASYRSVLVSGRVFGPLSAFVEAHDLGDCGVAEAGFWLSRDPDTLREPDVWFVRKERVPAAEEQAGFYNGPPDLTVEVISPSDRFPDVFAKAREYLVAGTRLLWLLDPGSRLTLVLRGDGRYTWLDESGTLDGEEVVPGFTLPLGRVFRQSAPPDPAP